MNNRWTTSPDIHEPRSHRSILLQLVAVWFELSAQAFRLSAQRGPIDTSLFWRFHRVENRSRAHLLGLLHGAHHVPDPPGEAPFIPPAPFGGRHTQMLRFAASFHQLAMTLALILSAFPRAFRDRTQANANSSTHEPSSTPTHTAENTVPNGRFRLSAYRAHAPPAAH